MKEFLTRFLLLIFLASVGTEVDAESRKWTFRVSLDNKEVGSQYFRLDEVDGKTRIETEADLAVKFVFVTVYRYLHRNVETWEDGCLSAIESSTRVNGKQLAVSGQRQDGFFTVSGMEDQGERLPECVMSFAYWDPRFLEQSRLLNSQSGEYVSIEVSGPVADQLTVRGKTRPALRYHLTAGKIDLQLWYSTDDLWLALESKTKGGRTLRYELL